MLNSSTLVARIHAYVRSAYITRRGSSWQSPDTIPRGTHKEYPRMPRVPLPAPGVLPSRLGDVLNKRASYNECPSVRALSLAEAGTLLGQAIGMRTDSLRRYPSGGALYPIETYLIGTVIEGYPRGVFHYHPKSHALEFLWETAASFDMADIVRSADIPPAPLAVVFTSIWERSSAKYGDLAYAHALIETGHMAENLLLVATALSIGARPMAGFDDAAIAELLDTDERLEQTVYAVLLCPPTTQTAGIHKKDEKNR